MSLIPWHNPFDEVEKMFGNFSGVANLHGFAPSVDVYETDKAVVVESPLPDVDPKDVEISIANDVLTIKGETRHQSEVDEKNYYRKEVRQGGFFRRVALPVAVEGDQADAEFKNGLLTITIAKAPATKGNTIKIAIKSK